MKSLKEHLKIFLFGLFAVFCLLMAGIVVAMLKSFMITMMVLCIPLIWGIGMIFREIFREIFIK